VWWHDSGNTKSHEPVEAVFSRQLPFTTERRGSGSSDSFKLFRNFHSSLSLPHFSGRPSEIFRECRREGALFLFPPESFNPGSFTWATAYDQRIPYRATTFIASDGTASFYSFTANLVPLNRFRSQPFPALSPSCPLGAHDTLSCSVDRITLSSSELRDAIDTTPPLKPKPTHSPHLCPPHMRKYALRTSSETENCSELSNLMT
jgi:hypothetical protein